MPAKAVFSRVEWTAWPTSSAQLDLFELEALRAVTDWKWLLEQRSVSESSEVEVHHLARSSNRGHALTRGWVAVLASVLAASDARASEGLVLVPELGLVVVLIILFALLILPLNALLFRPVLRVLDDRDEKIEGTRRRAEKLSADTDEVLGRYEASIREVREEAERDRKRLLDTARGKKAETASRARAEAESVIQSARNEVAEALTEARSFLRRDAELLANEAATRVLGRPLS